MAARTPCPPLWPKMPGPWLPTALIHSSTGWFMQMFPYFLPSLGEDSHCGSAPQQTCILFDLCAWRWWQLPELHKQLNQNRTVSRLNRLHMAVTHSEQQVCAGFTAQRWPLVYNCCRKEQFELRWWCNLCKIAGTLNNLCIIICNKWKHDGPESKCEKQLRFGGEVSPVFASWYSSKSFLTVPALVLMWADGVRKELNSKQAMRTCGLVSRRADLISPPPCGLHSRSYNGLIHPASAILCLHIFPLLISIGLSNVFSLPLCLSDSPFIVALFLISCNRAREVRFHVHSVISHHSH